MTPRARMIAVAAGLAVVLALTIFNSGGYQV